ncbi:MAG: hypothetical protein ACREA0_21935 [bacterium]
MLSRAQEGRVREVLGSHPSGTIRTCCLEHLATAAKIAAGHAADLAAFVRTLRKHGDCQTRSGGVCGAEGHETQQLLAWGPPTGLGAQRLESKWGEDRVLERLLQGLRGLRISRPWWVARPARLAPHRDRLGKHTSSL